MSWTQRLSSTQAIADAPHGVDDVGAELPP
jgi:hypothetical protein